MAKRTFGLSKRDKKDCLEEIRFSVFEQFVRGDSKKETLKALAQIEIIFKKAAAAELKDLLAEPESEWQ